MAIAGYGFGQEIKGSPDGLYTVPDASENAGNAQETTANHAAQSYLSSLDPQGEKYKRDMEKAEAMHKAMVAAKKARDLAEGGSDSNWLSAKPYLSEQVWIVIWAGLGLLVSLAVGGYVWWARIQASKANSAVLLALTRVPAAKPDGAGKQERPVRRRAA